MATRWRNYSVSRTDGLAWGSEIAAGILPETFCARSVSRLTITCHRAEPRRQMSRCGRCRRQLLFWAVNTLYLGPVCGRGSSWPAPPRAPGGPVPACTTAGGWGCRRLAAPLWDLRTTWQGTKQNLQFSPDASHKQKLRSKISVQINPSERQS